MAVPSKIIVRKCLVCGKKIRVKRTGRKYDNGHYFGKFKESIRGTGEYKKVGVTRFGGKSYPFVKWTSKSNEIEYWECNACFELAAHMAWLEELVEKLYGKKCPITNQAAPAARLGASTIAYANKLEGNFSALKVPITRPFGRQNS